MPYRMTDYRSMLRGLAIVGIALLVAGCTMTGGHDRAARTLPAGSTVTVHRPIDLPAGDARVYIQDGRAARWHDLDHFEAYCSFGLRKRAGDAELQKTIRPGTFATGSPRTRVQASRERAQPVRVAGPWLAMNGVPDGGPSAGRITYALVMPLESGQQPQVHDLTCAFDRDASRVNPAVPDLEAMRTALGEVATIRPVAAD